MKAQTFYLNEALLAVLYFCQEKGVDLVLLMRNWFLKMGFDGYVSKPLYINDLVDEMNRVMEA